ncbi:iron-regulated protein [Chromatium weissei]|nr:iron-regulated protein [Chromatium weissei]
MSSVILRVLTLIIAIFANAVIAAPPELPITVLDTTQLTTMNQLLERISNKRVIFVGERHDRYEDHLNQLAVIEGLQARGHALIIGMESFQQPFQHALDAFIAGSIDDAELLRRTEYFERWRYDYRLYRPLLHFARKHRIPVIALNLEAELTSKVGISGINGLNETERAKIPTDIDRNDSAYRQRIEAVFNQHPNTQKADFEHFLDVQLLWDEGMAARAAQALVDYPNHTLVVFAGAGHLEYRQGIPNRLLRRQAVAIAVLLNGTTYTPNTLLADFLMYPQSIELPPAGLLGVMLDPSPNSHGMIVKGFAESSGAKIAGLVIGDRIIRVGTTPITNYSDIRIALLDQASNQILPVEIERKAVVGKTEQLTFLVKLN